MIQVSTIIMIDAIPPTRLIDVREELCPQIHDSY